MTLSVTKSQLTGWVKIMLMTASTKEPTSFLVKIEPVYVERMGTLTSAYSGKAMARAVTSERT